MANAKTVDYAEIRNGMSQFDLSSRVEPNDEIALDRAFLPNAHRGVLDTRRSLVVGNRGMGKSFWTHALLNQQLRQKLATVYGLKALENANVVIGFNGSDKVAAVAPTSDEIAVALAGGADPDVIWQAVLLRGARTARKDPPTTSFAEAIREVIDNPELYSCEMSALDDLLIREERSLLVTFDALDRLGRNWDQIRSLSQTLLSRVLRLQSFRSIRAKVFIRVDQFSDTELFRFPDSSKLKNSSVHLRWEAEDLYGLMLFELLRLDRPGQELRRLARDTNTDLALPDDGKMGAMSTQPLESLINAIAGEFMGSHKKRGRVYTWIPLHLSDAADTCSPRTFLRAWGAAATHTPSPTDKVVDHLGLSEGVRQASRDRLVELQEDYPWIDPALHALRGEFVPIEREQLLARWDQGAVLQTILKDSASEPTKAPVNLEQSESLQGLLEAMKSIAVMEERANGKINVPDIFRVEAGIKRKGGVAVPRASK